MDLNLYEHEEKKLAMLRAWRTGGAASFKIVEAVGAQSEFISAPEGRYSAAWGGGAWRAPSSERAFLGLPRRNK